MVVHEGWVVEARLLEVFDLAALVDVEEAQGEVLRGLEADGIFQDVVGGLQVGEIMARLGRRRGNRQRAVGSVVVVDLLTGRHEAVAQLHDPAFEEPAADSRACETRVLVALDLPCVQQWVADAPGFGVVAAVDPCDVRELAPGTLPGAHQVGVPLR